MLWLLFYTNSPLALAAQLAPLAGPVAQDRTKGGSEYGRDHST
jgi:hypothetical protein